MTVRQEWKGGRAKNVSPCFRERGKKCSEERELLLHKLRASGLRRPKGEKVPPNRGKKKGGKEKELIVNKDGGSLDPVCGKGL